MAKIHHVANAKGVPCTAQAVAPSLRREADYFVDLDGYFLRSRAVARTL
jgi:hypothetical protein